MPVDPQIQAILDQMAGLPPMHTLSVPEARDRFAARDVPGLRIPQVGVTERSIAGPGGPLVLRIYTPEGQGPFPLTVFFHGSGFVVCSLDTHDAMCRNLCAGGGCVVVSVDYRLAPEHKFPAAPEDCLFATRWAAEHAAELNADPTRVVVAGDSAGGNLAAVTALRLRDEGGPALRGATADLSGDRLPRARHAVLCGERRGLRPDPPVDGVVLGPLSVRSGRRRRTRTRRRCGRRAWPACRRRW